MTLEKKLNDLAQVHHDPTTRALLKGWALAVRNERKNFNEIPTEHNMQNLVATWTRASIAYQYASEPATPTPPTSSTVDMERKVA